MSDKLNLSAVPEHPDYTYGLAVRSGARLGVDVVAPDGAVFHVEGDGWSGPDGVHAVTHRMIEERERVAAQTWKERSDTLLAEIEDGDRDEVMARHLALVNERLDAEELRGMVWMVMPYKCDRCGLVAWYEAEVGVEGPPAWREDGTYISTPFVAGSCSSKRGCGGSFTHLMRGDVEFETPVEPGTEFEGRTHVGLIRADRFFRVPREPVRYPTHGCSDDGYVIYSTATHAFLSYPMHAIRREMERRRG